LPTSAQCTATDDKFVEVNLWDRGLVYSSHPSRHMQLTTGNVEEKIKKFITDWNLDNKR